MYSTGIILYWIDSLDVHSLDVHSLTHCHSLTITHYHSLTVALSLVFAARIRSFVVAFAVDISTIATLGIYNFAPSQPLTPRRKTQKCSNTRKWIYSANDIISVLIWEVGGKNV